MLPKGQTAPHLILPKAGLAFVDASRSAVRQWRAFKSRIDAHLVQGMTSLVQGAKETLRQIGFTKARGNPHIIQGELGHKRVVGFVLPTPLKIIAKLLDNLDAKVPLCFLRECLGQTTIINRRLGANGFDDGLQVGA